jgi:methylthioribose-1-phosphate isomerase
MLLATLDAAFHVLAASRPTAVNLFWALDRMRATLASHTAHAAGSAQIAIALSDAATALIAEDIAANHRLGDFGATLLADGARVLTHCNAGALATAGHGTALGVIRSAVAAGKRIAVWADETRPVLQGARLTAWELARDGIPVTLLPDGAAGLLMARGAVDAVIVGADRIAANGDTANKVGTFMVALAAARHGIPFHVAAPTSTFDSTRPDGRAIPIEERDADEVRGVGASLVAPRDVAVFNPAFDVTPADLIATIVTEHGVIERPDTARIAAFFAAWER